MGKLSKIIVALLLAIACAPRAHADSFDTFNVLGTDITTCLAIPSGLPIPGCTPTFGTFSGTLTVDVTTGAILVFDLPAFGIPLPSGPLARVGVDPDDPSDSQLGALAGGGTEAFRLDFTTPTPGSLVGFDGGTIVGGSLIDNSNVAILYLVGGSITAPEPSSFALMLLGVGLLFVLRKRNSQGHQLAT